MHITHISDTVEFFLLVALFTKTRIEYYLLQYVGNIITLLNDPKPQSHGTIQLCLLQILQRYVRPRKIQLTCFRYPSQTPLPSWIFPFMQIYRPMETSNSPKGKYSWLYISDQQDNEGSSGSLVENLFKFHDCRFN